jgi:hypothetical protein
LYIDANRDFIPWLYIGINIDSANPVKNYLFTSHGDNAAQIEYSDQTQWRFNSDHDLPDAGGYLQLTEFDTIQKIFSGNLQFVSYSQDRSIRKVLSGGVFTHVPFAIDDTSVYNGNYAECVVTGATTTNWHTKDMTAHISERCGLFSTLTLEINSIIGGFAQNRYLSLQIPLHNSPGTYPVQTELEYLPCGSNVVKSYYNINNINNTYHATSGTIDIISIDTAQKLLNANFNISFQDTLRHETIQITNGSVQLKGWKVLL